MCRHFGSVHLGTLDFWFLYSQIAFHFEGMFKSNQRRAGQDHQGWRLALTAGKTTPNKR